MPSPSKPASPPSRKRSSRQPPSLAKAPASTGERALLAELRRRAAPPVGHADPCLRLGIGDDCAILRPPAGDEIVVTTDLFLEQVHFRRDWHQPEVAGYRCLARGLSDIAAMGARPIAAFLSFALPPELAGEWVRRFLSGLLSLAKRHGVPLAGGDTAAAPPSQSPIRLVKPQANAPGGALFTADIVLLGAVARGQALLRSGATPGDLLYVTGALGGAAAELALLEQSPADYARLLLAREGHPHLFPIPRLGVSQALLGRATAALDLSDGLSTDLAHLCEESHVAAEVEAALVPVHSLALASPQATLPAPRASKTSEAKRRDQARQHALHLALSGGEDYELLFTAPALNPLPPTLAGVPIHPIGSILEPTPSSPPGSITLIQPDGSRAPLLNRGWEHLSPTRRPAKRPAIPSKPRPSR